MLKYFPVAWTNPEAGREALVGLDHAHDAQRGSALARAVASNAMTSTPPLSAVANSPEGRLVQTLYAPPSSLPPGLIAQLEADLRQYDFATLESRVRDALAQDGVPDDDDDGHALHGIAT